MTNIYRDIAERTDGDIYIGVVGPVRTGKSTFVTQFMDKLILPNIKDKNSKRRTVDELPQAADGVTIMTTQPKFVPNEAVKITLADKGLANVRLIDCVGYLVEGAEGHLEGDKARLVKTPWSAEPMPFEEAAEIGTQKVVSEHSTIAIVVTNDGTVTELPRKNYIPAEERVIKELKALGKPFIVLLNSRNPSLPDTVSLAGTLEEKYGVSVLPMDIAGASAQEFEKVLQSILGEFPVRRIKIELPRWMRTLDKDARIISYILEKVKAGCGNVVKMKDAAKMLEAFEDNEDIELPEITGLDMGKGSAEYSVSPKPRLFYKVLSETAGMDISDEFTLMSYVAESAYAKTEFDGIKDALQQARETGYGVVNPATENMKLEEPEIVKQGSRYGVRLKATAPSLHIMRVDVNTEVSPMVGTEQQSQYLLSEFQQNPKQIWDTNMFGKSLSSLAREGLTEKCASMPTDMQDKLVKTVGKIVNEGRGGLICLLL